MPRSKIVQIRLSDIEWSRLQNKAKAVLGSDNVSAYIRYKCLSNDLSEEEMISALYRKFILENKGVSNE